MIASYAMGEIPPGCLFVPRFYDASSAAAGRVCAKLRDVLGESAWRIEAPENVHVTPWREADGACVVHFLNSTGAPEPVAGESPAKGVPEVAFPSPAEDIVVTLPADGATTAVATSPDFAGEHPLRITVNPDGVLTFVLPRDLLKAYTLVRVR